MGLFQKTTSDIDYENSIEERTPCKGRRGCNKNTNIGLDYDVIKK